jgi:hypothetical protein
MAPLPPPPPPPGRAVAPILARLPAGGVLVRIYDPTEHRATPTGFRHWGPLHRFDHHRGDPAGAPALDEERGIYYASPEGLLDAPADRALDALAGSVIEVFADGGEIRPGDRRVARIRAARPLTLLDLRRNGAMRAGTMAALAMDGDCRTTQAWGRYFYEQVGVYGAVDGLVYHNAHNEIVALALYERARDALLAPMREPPRLDHPDLLPRLYEIGRDHGLPVVLGPPPR